MARLSRHASTTSDAGTRGWTTWRAGDSFGQHYGNYYAAAITYFSVLSVVPILMLAFAVAAIVLAGNPVLLAQLQIAIGAQLPDAVDRAMNRLVRGAIDDRATVGVIGLATHSIRAGWMTHLQNALTEQWGLARSKLPLLSTAVKDLLALVGLGVGLVMSFGITAAGGALGSLLLRQAGLAQGGWTRGMLTVLSVLLALSVNWVVLLWVIARLPRRPVSPRLAMSGALLASVGFEVLKQIASILITQSSHSPTGAVFGPVIGLLVFTNLIARFLLFATAWTATARPRHQPHR